MAIGATSRDLYVEDGKRSVSEHIYLGVRIIKMEVTSKK
jgi:hypothetical protein